MAVKLHIYLCDTLTDEIQLKVPDTVVKTQNANVFENLSDTLLNAFSKVRKPDERFTEFKDQLDKFEENITTIEKLHAKLVKIQTGWCG
jgi:sorting nexin-4